MKTINGHENFRVHCTLQERMTAAGLTVDEFHKIARVSRETLGNWRRNKFKGFSTSTVGRVAGALGCGIGDLFVLLPEDIWLPIRLAKEVTIHFGSRAFTEPRPARNGDGNHVSRELMGTWDFKTFQLISEHLMRLQRDIHVKTQLHVTGPRRINDPTAHTWAERVFERGNHIFIGSPRANGITEEVVCKAYGVAPYNPQMRGKFPYSFLWDDWREVLSSFGAQQRGKQCGISAMPSNRIVAPHVNVASGKGSDGGLILTYRVFQAPARRESDDDDERVVICLLGYSGPGTLATAQIATNPECAAGLFPPARKVPRMRAVRCKHVCEASPIPGDNREVKEAELVPEQCTPPPASTLRAAAGGSRRGR